PVLELPVRRRLRAVPPRLWSQLSRVRRNTIGLIGAAIIAATLLVASVGPLAWRADYADQAARRLLAPSAVPPLGTDELGRDELSRIIHGAQVSLQVGMISVIIALVFGTTAGITAGFYGRTVDAVLMRGVDIMFAFPGLVLAIVIAGLLG